MIVLIIKFVFESLFKQQFTLRDFMKIWVLSLVGWLLLSKFWLVKWEYIEQTNTQPLDLQVSTKKEDLEILSWKNEYNEVIKCFSGGVITDTINWKCRTKNIIYPNKNIMEIIAKRYIEEKIVWLDKDWFLIKKSYCWNKCIEQISNRLALINFESWFNPDAISPTNDYWIIQVHNWKDFLWFDQINTSLEWLDVRWKEQAESLCIAKMKVKSQDEILRCLYMRHNWQRGLYNPYSNKLMVVKGFYKKHLTSLLKNGN